MFFYGWASGADGVEQVTDACVAFDGVAEPACGVDLVGVASADAMAGEHAGLFEVLHDLLHGAFGDADLLGDVPEPGIGITRQADEDVGVVGEVGPLGLGGGRIGSLWAFRERHGCFVTSCLYRESHYTNCVSYFRVCTRQNQPGRDLQGIFVRIMIHMFQNDSVFSNG